jgi:endogenous inhibitor of DNA gyrase (YacG/DUF329 family)
MIRAQTCPICEKDLVAVGAPPEFFPFCSQRCREVDLYRWSLGKYAVVESIDPETLDENPVDDPSDD